MRKSRWARRAAFLGCFTALGLFSGSRIWLGAAYSARPVTWPMALGFALADWYAWGLVAPVVFLLARRFPFERQGGRPWLRALAVHLPAGVALTVVKMLIEHAAAQSIAFNPARRLSVLYFHPNFLTYLAILGVVVALDARRRLHEQRQRASALETRLAQARLDALRTQLQPHFLFNTLNAVTALMRHDVRAAESMLVGLADLLRMSLAGGGAQQVALSGEIELIRKYLEILSIRYGERLS
ncbi:MAG TPA: histidine kinase, partial [Candidatus Polarisedimenticolia bacterium]|nr:histidine kinase [Candidatus Polarisedimenticolia bacterium]